MNILFIAPLPPPITGHSLVSQVLFDDLQKKHNIWLVNIKKKSFKEGVDGLSRITEIVLVLGRVFVYKHKSDAIYLTVSESLAGNLKDIFIYLICYFRLKKMIIHLHGGKIRKELWNKRKWIFKLNRFFIGKMGGVIISGNSHLEIYNDFVSNEKIHVVKNFALDYLFAKEESIRNKFIIKDGIVKILYMSHMIPKKGYIQLLNAFLSLNEAEKSNLRLDFVGAFDSESSKDSFIRAIKDEINITYHGVLNENSKQHLFQEAHIFCLPTSYFEGQPISILEAYASGCAIFTTGQPGILDIFKDGINGFQITPEPESIAATLLKALKNKEQLKNIAIENNRQAIKMYRTENYTQSISRLLEIIVRNT